MITILLKMAVFFSVKVILFSIIITELESKFIINHNFNTKWRIKQLIKKKEFIFL